MLQYAPSAPPAMCHEPRTCAQTELQRQGVDLVVFQVEAPQPRHENHVTEGTKAIAGNVQVFERR